MFKKFDVDNTDSITLDNIKNCFLRYGIDLKDDEIKRWIKDFDIDNNNVISKDEFIIMMKSEGVDKRMTTPTQNTDIIKDQFMTKLSTDSIKIEQNNEYHYNQMSKKELRLLCSEHNNSLSQILSHQGSFSMKDDSNKNSQGSNNKQGNQKSQKSLFN